MNIFDSMKRAFNDMKAFISQKIAPYQLDEKTMPHFLPEEIREVQKYIIDKTPRHKIKDDIFDRFFKNPYAGTLYAIYVDPSATTSDGKTIEDLMTEDTSFGPLMLLDYIIKVKHSRWYVFEERALNEFWRGSHEAGALVFYYLERYLNNQRWRELENLIIDLYKSDRYDFDMMAYYIVKVLNGNRWDEIEPIIKEKYIKDNYSKDWNLYRNIISGKPYVPTKPDADEIKQYSDAMLEAYKQNQIDYEKMADYARKYLNNKWDDFGKAILEKYDSGYNNFNEIQKYIANFNNKQRWLDFEKISHYKLQRENNSKDWNLYKNIVSDKMGFQKLCLNYKDETGKIVNDLITADIKEKEGFSVEKFYYTLDKVIRILSQNNSFDIIRKFPTEKPIYLFGVLFYCLKDMDTTNDLELEFDYLKEFVDYKIDICMVVNYLKEITCL